MHIIDIYKQWTEFINDDEYKKFLYINNYNIFSYTVLT